MFQDTQDEKLDEYKKDKKGFEKKIDHLKRQLEVFVGLFRMRGRKKWP